MTKPDWLHVHTPLETIRYDGIATFRTSFVRLCDGNYCSAMILDEFYFQAYCHAECVTDIPELILMMTNMFSEEELFEALRVIVSKGYARIEISEDYYVAYELSLDAIHRDLAVTTSFDARQTQEIEVTEPQKASIDAKPQRSGRNEAKVVRFHNKRASSVALPATLTLDQWRQTLKDFDNKCAYCPDGNYDVLEHFVPLIFGGGTTEYNCVPSCSSCNRIKSDQHPLMMPENCEITGGLLNVQRYLETKQG